MYLHMYIRAFRYKMRHVLRLLSLMGTIKIIHRILHTTCMYVCVFICNLHKSEQIFLGAEMFLFLLGIIMVQDDNVFY